MAHFSRSAARVVDRLVSALAVVRMTGRSRATRAVVVGVAALFLIAGGVAAVATGALDLAALNWAMIAALFVTSPLTLYISVLEYQLAARSLSARVARSHALRVSVLGHTANYLPVPGGPLVRLGDLQVQTHRPPRHAAMAIAAIGTAWLGAGAVVAAFGLLRSGALLWSVALVVMALGAILATWVLVRRVTDPQETVGVFAGIVALEFLTVLLTAGRLVLAMAALGVSIDLLAALAMSAAGPFAALIGVVPGGLGLKEGIAEVLGRVAGLVALEGFAVSMVIRVVDSVVVGVAGVATLGTRD